MAGQEDAGQQLRLLHDDAAARPQNPGELAQGPGGLRDVMQHVAAPHPVERGVREGKGGRVALTEVQARARERAGGEGTGRLDPLGRRLDADHATVGPHGLGEPERVQPDAAPHVEAVRVPRGRPRSAMRVRASGSWKRFIRSSAVVNGSVGSWLTAPHPSTLGVPRWRRPGCRCHHRRARAGQTAPQEESHATRDSRRARRSGSSEQLRHRESTRSIGPRPSSFPPWPSSTRAATAATPTSTSYGMHGTPTTFALAEAVADLSGARHAIMVSSGLAAITQTLTALLRQGDHLLVADSVYGPTRAFCHLGAGPPRRGRDVLRPARRRRHRRADPGDDPRRLRGVAGLADLRGPGRSGHRRRRPRPAGPRRDGQHVGDASQLPRLRARGGRRGPGGHEVPRRPLRSPAGDDRHAR